MACLIIVKGSPSTVGKNSLIISTLKMLLSTEDLRYSLKLISCLTLYSFCTRQEEEDSVLGKMNNNDKYCWEVNTKILIVFIEIEIIGTQMLLVLLVNLRVRRLRYRTAFVVRCEMENMMVDIFPNSYPSNKTK